MQGAGGGNGGGSAAAAPANPKPCTLAKPHQLPHSASLPAPHTLPPNHASQVWQWVRYGATLDGKTVCTPALVRQVIEEELEAIRKEVGGSEK